MELESGVLGNVSMRVSVGWTRNYIPWLVLYIMAVAVVMGMPEASKSHDHQLYEEEDEDRHETDALNP